VESADISCLPEGSRENDTAMPEDSMRERLDAEDGVAIHFGGGRGIACAHRCRASQNSASAMRAGTRCCEMLMAPFTKPKQSDATALSWPSALGGTAQRMQAPDRALGMGQR
jgi:hypothetical protein